MPPVEEGELPLNAAIPDKTVPDGAVVSLEATLNDASTEVLEDDGEEEPPVALLPNLEGIETGAVDDDVVEG